MYKITYIQRGDTKEYPLYTAGDQTYCLISGKLTLGCGKAGSLTLEIPDINPAKDDILCLTDEIIVYRDNDEIWRGRAVTTQMDFDRTGTLECEGILAYLYDSVYPPFEFSGSPKDFLQNVLDNHNEQVEVEKQFALGDVTVADSNDYISRSSIEYDRSLNVLSDKLINDSLGGYFRVRIDGATRYLDYLENYNTQASQMVQYGSNLLDIAEEIEYSDLATVIVPLGAKLEDADGVQTDEYLTIASVNNGKYYYADDAAVEAYGWIAVIAEWEDVTVASNLLEKAKTYLEQCTSAVSSFEVNAVDLSLISDETPICLGDYVWIRSEAHNINQYVELTEQSLDILDPSKDVLTFGSDSTTITGSQKTTQRSVQSALGSLSMRVTNMTTEVLNAVYANIETIVAQTVNADYIKAIVADIGYLTADEIEAKYVSIENLQADIANLGYLTADSAIIIDLTAFSENVGSLLAGNAGVGDLQTIHLTADNVVIDSAVIMDIIAADATIGSLISGYIYTDYIKIANNEGKQLWIDGATIQLKDDNDIVRVQIGEDGEGDYNLYLWDAAGSMLWDAKGLTHEGLTGNGQIIKDDAVAEDAAIKGSKLDIHSVASYLTEDGSLVVNASNVTINDETLDAAYTTIIYNQDGLSDSMTVLQTELEVVQGLIDMKVWQTDIENAIEGLELEFDLDGIVEMTPYFALWNSGEKAPPDTITPALVDTAIVDESIIGFYDSDLWSTDEPYTTEDGYYKWIKWLLVYADGTETWSTPYCLTDLYSRSLVTDTWSELTILDDSITSTVTEMRTETAEHYDSLSDLLNDLSDQTTINYEYLSTQIEQLSDQINFTITDTLQSIYETEEGLQSQIEEYNTYFSFDSDGLHISKNNSPFAVVLGIDQLSFMENEAVVAYISNSMLYIHDAEVLGSLKIAGFRWEIGSTGNLNLVKVSEKSAEEDNLVTDAEAERSATNTYIAYDLTDYGKSVVRNQRIEITFEGYAETNNAPFDAYMRTSSGSNIQETLSDLTQYFTTSWKQYTFYVTNQDNDDSISVAVRCSTSVTGGVNTTFHVRNMFVSLTDD